MEITALESSGERVYSISRAQPGTSTSHPHVLCPIIKCFPWHSFEHVNNDNNDSRPGVWWREYQSCHKEILGPMSTEYDGLVTGDCVCLGRCCDQGKQRPMEGRWSQWKFKMHNLQRNWILAPTVAGLMNWWGAVTAAVVRGTCTDSAESSQGLV